MLASRAGPVDRGDFVNRVFGGADVVGIGSVPVGGSVPLGVTG